MSRWKIAWRSVQRRGLASALTGFSMALGVMLVVGVVSIHGLVEESFRNNSSIGYNMIVGAKGGSLQLVLNTVYYLSEPVENIPYSYYQEFLSARQIVHYRDQLGVEELGEERDGRFNLFAKFAIPVCLGDYYGRFRVVGTTPELFDAVIYDPLEGKRYEFDQGRNFKTFSDKHGYFECVVGSNVAREHTLQIGATISATHGDPEGELHDEHPFTIVGILKPSGTPNDRAVFVNIEGFYLMDGHAKPLEKEDVTGTAVVAVEAATQDENQPSKKEFRPISVREREVTAILVKTVNQVVTPGLSENISEGPDAQAALPVREIYGLFHAIVGPIQQMLLLMTVMICVVSGISILVSIYNSMSDRQQEIAIMRALGAGRSTVMSVVFFESIILSLGGGLLGWLGGHILIGLASPQIEERTGVAIGFVDFPAIRLNDHLDVQIILDLINALGRFIGAQPVQNLMLPTELWLIPGLLLLAILVGFLPAMAAYRTDIAKALSANP